MFFVVKEIQLAFHPKHCLLMHYYIVLSSWVTGIVVAIHGKETGAGDFLVQDVLEAGLPPQIEVPLKTSTASQLFISVVMPLP